MVTITMPMDTIQDTPTKTVTITMLTGITLVTPIEMATTMTVAEVTPAILTGTVTVMTAAEVILAFTQGIRAEDIRAIPVPPAARPTPAHIPAPPEAAIPAPDGRSDRRAPEIVKNLS